MERGEELQIRKNIVTLRHGLVALHDKRGRYSDVPEIETEFRKRLGMILWEVLPQHVVTLDLGDGLQMSRPDEEARYLPLNQRETWDLPTVDQYGARLSQSVMQKWEPVFPPPKIPTAK